MMFTKTRKKSLFGGCFETPLSKDEYAELACSRFPIICKASKDGNLEFVQQLIDEGEDVTVCKNYPVILAAEFYHNDVVIALLSAGASVEAAVIGAFNSGNYALLAILWKEYLPYMSELSKLLIRSVASNWQCQNK